MSPWSSLGLSLCIIGGSDLREAVGAHDGGVVGCVTRSMPMVL